MKPITTKSLLAKYNRLEDSNYHTECVILLAKHFGTQDELETLEKIKKAQIKRGHILQEDIDLRNVISRKYYPLLHV